MHHDLLHGPCLFYSPFSPNKNIWVTKIFIFITNNTKNNSGYSWEWFQVGLLVKILLGTSSQAAYGHDYSTGDNDTLGTNLADDGRY